MYHKWVYISGYLSGKALPRIYLTIELVHERKVSTLPGIQRAVAANIHPAGS